MAGSDFAENAAIGFVPFAGVGVVAPRAYLARPDDNVPAVSRARAAAIVTSLLAGSFSGTAVPGQRTAIPVAGLVPVGVLVGYEVLAGYRESRPRADPDRSRARVAEKGSSVTRRGRR